MIKLLLDANLSYRLVKKLSDNYPNCIHVSKTGLPNPAKDIQIWEWAKNEGFIIVSNDADFERLLYTFGFPPKVVLFKTGNQRTEYIANTLISKFSDIEDFFQSDEIGMLEIV